jgi:hypothetical protein
MGACYTLPNAVSIDKYIYFKKNHNKWLFIIHGFFMIAQHNILKMFYLDLASCIVNIIAMFSNVFCYFFGRFEICTWK